MVTEGFDAHGEEAEEEEQEAEEEEEEAEEDEEEEEEEMVTPRPKKRRRSSGSSSAKRRKASMESHLIELHRRQKKINKEEGMQSEGFQNYLRLAMRLLRFDVNAVTVGGRYTVVCALLMVIDSFCNSREGVVDRSVVSTAYKLSNASHGRTTGQHMMLRQLTRGVMRFTERYKSDDHFLNFAFAERSKDKDLPYAYDRANLKSRDYTSKSCNLKPLFVIVKHLLKNHPDLLKGVKQVMSKSYKDYLEGTYATELLKILSDEHVECFVSLLLTVLWYHYEESHEFAARVEHYNALLESNDMRLLDLLESLEDNLEHTNKGANLIIRASIMRDHMNLLFTMFHSKQMQPTVWKNLVNVHLKKSRVKRKGKVSGLTAYLFGHKESCSIRKEEDKSYNQVWHTKAFFDGNVCQCFELLKPYLKDADDVGLRVYKSIAETTKGTSTNKYYSVWPVAFKQAATEKGLNFEHGIPDGRNAKGIQSSMSDSKNGAANLKDLSTLYMDQYVNGIIKMCTLKEDDLKEDCNKEVAKMMLKTVKTLIIMSVARYDKPLYNAFLNDTPWQSLFRTCMYQALTMACQVKQGGSTRKREEYMEDAQKYIDSYSLVEDNEEEQNKWREMTRIKQPVIETVDMEEEEDDL